MKGVGIQLHSFLTSALGHMSAQLHAPAALSWCRAPVAITERAEWDPGQVWTLWRSEPRSAGCSVLSLVTLLAQLPATLPLLVGVFRSLYRPQLWAKCSYTHSGRAEPSLQFADMDRATRALQAATSVVSCRDTPHLNRSRRGFQECL
jgi:hypothetical protein